MDFTGKVVLVTGGTSGIGRETALRFAQVSDGASFVTGTSLPVDGGWLAQ